jgi:hypothetical protein
MDAHLIALLRVSLGLVLMTMVLIRIAVLVRRPVYGFAGRFEQSSGSSTPAALGSVVFCTALLSMAWLVGDNGLPLMFRLKVRYLLLGVVLIDLTARAFRAPFGPLRGGGLTLVMSPKARTAFRRDWFDERDDLRAEGCSDMFIWFMFWWRIAGEFREVIRGLFIQLVVGIVRSLLP